MVVTLVSLGKHMEASSKHKTTGAIRKLMELTPDTALLKGEGGSLTEVPTEILRPGDVVLVRPGERVPLDGEVLEGEGGVDESMLTGESLPVEKAPGSEVTGGSISVNGSLTVRNAGGGGHDPRQDNQGRGGRPGQKGAYLQDGGQGRRACSCRW